MRFLCIDLGDKRSGLAICDEAEIFASPLEVLATGNDFADKVVQTAKQYQAEGIVVGLPLNMDGSEGPRAKIVRKFSEELAEKTEICIYFQDERLSSFSAGNNLNNTGLTHKKKKGRLDAIAASEILKEFLSARKNEANRE